MATEVGALPDDALAAVFRGLSLRSMAVVRSVCKAWRDVVDARALLLRHLHLLPLTVRGVFINYKYHDHPHHFARPCSSPSTTIPRVDGTLSFLPSDDDSRPVSVLDHCNGLLLCGGEAHDDLSEHCVCNPATCRWTVLPRWWEEDDEPLQRYAAAYIAFDPAESPHYQVILIPAVPKKPLRWSAAEMEWRALLWEMERDAPFCLDWFFSLPEDDGTSSVGPWEFQQLPSDLLPPHDINDPCRYMEWPPAPWKLRVFSSSTDQWEDRAFVREGLPAGTVEKMRSDYFESQHRPRRGYAWPRQRYAVFHHGSLYVHCHGSFVARLSLSKSKYQIIETPGNVDEHTKPYFGKLQNAVCFGIVQDHQLKIWILNELCGHMEWVLKYETVVGQYAEYLASITSKQRDGPWTIEENIKFLSEQENIEIQGTDHNVESVSEEGHGWDSDNDDTFTYTGSHFDDYEQLSIIGFHPYKEVVFMVRQFCIVAYHLNSSKIQYLGDSCTKYCYLSDWNKQL